LGPKDMFKKIALSALVVATFVAYSIHARLDQNKTVATPTSLQTPSATSNTPAQTAAIPPSQNMPMQMPMGQYKDGSYTGSVADAFYGNIQVVATISGGKLTDIVFLQYPNDRDTSVMINRQAMPFLKQEAIQAQSAQVDGVSGATDSSQAFVQSLSAALSQAKNT